MKRHVGVHAVVPYVNKRWKGRLAREQNRPRQSITEPERWVIGAIDRVTGIVAMHVLPYGRHSRTATECRKFIEEHTHPLTMVATDTANCYSSAHIQTWRYHVKCNHSVGERVVPGLQTVGGRAVGTQSIEQMWNQVRSFLHDWGVDKCRIDNTETVQMYMNEYTWRKNNGLLRNDGAAFKVLCEILKAKQE